MSALSPSGPPLPWRVAVPRPLPAYDFAPPHGYTGPVPLGCRCAVPWRGELVVGLVVGAGDARQSHRLREAVSLLDDAARPWVSPVTLAALSEWAATVRLPLGLVWSDLLGVGWQPALQHRVRASAGADLRAFAENAAPAPVPGEEWAEAGGFLPQLLDAIREQGLLDEDLSPAVPTVTRLVATEKRPGKGELTARQEHAAQWLQMAGPQESLAAWARGAGVSGSVAAAVLSKGDALLREEAAPPPALTAAAPAWRSEAEDALPRAQQWRLSGGKWGARVSALAPRLQAVLDAGGSALVLAPDHAALEAAWQALSGLAAGAGTGAALISGQLSAAQRLHTWQNIQRGGARLVLGSYLALAAPLQDLRLILLLDEGSDAYKLQGGSRLWLPDAVQAAAKAWQAELGAAGTVPAVETVTWPALELPAPRVRLHTVDYSRPPVRPAVGPLSLEAGSSGPTGLGYPLSHNLKRVLRQVEERGRQAALLAPRRGYSALLRCPQCDHTPQCSQCDVPLRFHQQAHVMTCHQCGVRQPVPKTCERCGAGMLETHGPGTEWLAEEVRRLLPGTPVYRLDKDHQDDLSDLYAGKSGVVVGTQLLLLRPAPPELALVAVTLADTWLNVPDFRASERYHALLWQLAAWHPTRAPLLLVQTFQGNHPALEALREGSSVSQFPLQEWHSRQALGYPPHVQLAQLDISARDQAKAQANAERVAAALYAAGATLPELLGPAPAPIARVRGMYAYQLLLRARNLARLGELLAAADAAAGRLRVDISPR